MKTLSGHNCRYAVVLVWFLCVAACSPPGSGDEAPPVLEVDRTALTFGPAEDIKPLLVKNSGGSSLSFTAQVSASSGGVEWLQASP